MKYLLSISIGPVQDFIATARRSRDLWFGSWLLSEVSKAAAKEIGHDKLIFPSVEKPSALNPDSDFNVVNKILAVIDGDQRSIKGLCDRIEERIKERLLGKDPDSKLEGLVGDSFAGLPNDGTFHKNVAKKQLDDLVEVYWAALPLNGNYAKARDHVEGLLAARKTTRDFKAVSWHNRDLFVPKSSLDGQRESVIDESVYRDVEDGGWTKDRLYKVFKVRPGERLCGVGLFKRQGNRKGDDSFFSTSHVAALPLLEQLRDKTAVCTYIGKLRDCGLDERNGLNTVPLYKDKNNQPINEHPAFGRWDGHLLFEERLSDYIEGKDRLKKAREALQDFLETALNRQNPFPYYALLLADGDHMGKAIDAQAAKRDSDHEGDNGITRLKDISKQLSEFAKAVRDIVQVEHKGSLVYAGGDDVLAFVPLHKVLDCARALAKRFKEDLSESKFADENGRERSPSLSVGLAVAHHLDPLSDTLDLARQAEKTAKEAGRNALAVTVSKRSGADLTIKGRWGEIDSRLQSFTELHIAGAIPDCAAYELRELSRDLSKLPDSIRVEAMTREALRILRRKRVNVPATLTDDAKKRFEKFVRDAFKSLETHIENTSVSPKEFSLEHLANELIAARTFARAMKQAGITVEEVLQSSEPQKEGANEDMDH